MENNNQKNMPWMSIPQFGDWEQNGVVPDYSMDFSKVREMRKLNKRDPSRASLGNEEEFFSSNTQTKNATQIDPPPYYHHHQTRSPTTMRGIFSCFNCFFSKRSR
ncbi:uncharacterized protein LOC124927334 [Impatiens glandulifera]|uniref:uncharacterized protein LOC124927334 n=1 Tax=Impatiens glandulifera TaxID=253017 RepID=UPI001FB19077|nr:uncharacterized protein LOC124927334 [Impatiens glandulifera]